MSGIPLEKLLFAEIYNKKIATFFEALHDPIMNIGINSETNLFAYEAHRSIE